MVYQKVLVPVGGKFQCARAERALEQALQIVRKDGEICLLHCVGAEKHGEPQIIREMEKLFNRLAVRVKDAGIAYSISVAPGLPETQIPIFASNNNYNIVSMCTEIDDGFVRDSVAASVFQNLSVPLLIAH